MTNERKPQPGEWWGANDGSGNAYICGFDFDGDPVFQTNAAENACIDVMRVFIEDWHHEPDCTGFDWKPETWPKWYVPQEKRVSAYGKEIEYYRHDAKDGGGETFHVDGTSFRFAVWDIGNAKAVTEAEAKALLTPVESPDDWVTQDRVPMRASDQFQWSHWPSYYWRPAFLTWIGKPHGWIDPGDGRMMSVRCRRKDLPAKPKTREVVFREYAYWGNPEQVFIDWRTDPPTQWDYYQQIGEPRTITIPVD